MVCSKNKFTEQNSNEMHIFTSGRDKVWPTKFNVLFPETSEYFLGSVGR